MDQRNTSDVNQKKYQMAYGGGPSDSLSKLMQKRQPIAPSSATTASSNGGHQINIQVIQDLYQKAMIHHHIASQASQAGIKSSFLEGLQKEDRANIKETDDEMKRRGFFKRIFPCLDFLYYRQFFEEERLINYVIDAKLYAKKRNINPVQIRKI